jgi:hypothetical protein
MIKAKQEESVMIFFSKIRKDPKTRTSAQHIYIYGAYI